ncbi:hypothetical protein IC232_16035 [Microvirga sp. BT688]|uniref:hypothetical protein n=1 Tax=Microvirga sp. TaxID=1873136 RepID=UPI001684D0E6|nr:hypothetical protein [Microvirga sp.]MBD2748208.1 hypothetical protein [Microvirga sp.]
MLKKSDIQPSPCGSEDLEYYKLLARLAEQRARDIRRIAALEREQLEKFAARRGSKTASFQLQNDLNKARIELEEFRRTHAALAASRAHALADAYIRLATGNSVLARALQPLRRVAHIVFPRPQGAEAPYDQE